MIRNKNQAILVMQNYDFKRLCWLLRAGRHVFAMKDKGSFEINENVAHTSFARWPPHKTPSCTSLKVGVLEEGISVAHLLSFLGICLHEPGLVRSLKRRGTNSTHDSWYYTNLTKPVCPLCSQPPWGPGWGIISVNASSFFSQAEIWAAAQWDLTHCNRAARSCPSNTTTEWVGNK